MCEIKIQKEKIISALTEHIGETIDMGLIMNLLVEMETRKEIEPVEYCKYLNKHGNHAEIIDVCIKWHHDCVKRAPCAFFVAYSREVS